MTPVDNFSSFFPVCGKVWYNNYEEIKGIKEMILISFFYQHISSIPFIACLYLFFVKFTIYFNLMESFYRLILKKAFWLTWKNRWLWVLGFFAAIIGNGGVYEALIRGFNNISEGRSVFNTFQEYVESGIFGMLSWAKLDALWQSDSSAFGVTIFTLLTILCVLAVMITLGVIGQGAVISGVIGLDEKEPMKLKSSFRMGVDRFWPVLEINVITKVILLGFLLMIAYFASLIVSSVSAVNIFVYVLSFIIFLILGIVIYFLTIYGTAYVILRRKSVREALWSAWHLFRRHVLLNLEMGLILFILNVVTATLFFAGCFVLLSPLFVLYFLFLVAGSEVVVSILMAVMVLLFVVMMLLVGSWWSTFQLGVWALLFEKLELSGGKSKVLRLYEHFLKLIKPSRIK